MPSRGRRRESSQRIHNRTIDGALRRQSTSRGRRGDSLGLRRSTRLSDLYTAIEGESLRAERPAIRALLTSSRDPTVTNVGPGGASNEIYPQQTRQDGIDSGNLNQSSTNNCATIRSPSREIVTYPELWTNGIVGQGSFLHNMKIVVEPPNRARPGHVLCPPLVMSLEQGTGHGSGTVPPCDPSLLWAVVSVVSEDDTTPLAPPRPDLLLGTPVDSVHSLMPNSHAREVGFVSFPDLAIREPGRYRLRISLICMYPTGATDSTAFEGCTNLQSMSSRVITVDPAAEPPTLGLSPALYLLRKLTVNRQRRAQYPWCLAATGTANRMMSRIFRFWARLADAEPHNLVSQIWNW